MLTRIRKHKVNKLSHTVRDELISYQEQYFLNSFAVRSWYDLLTPVHTFRTVLLPLTHNN
jgi:hypothetical protein